MKNSLKAMMLDEKELDMVCGGSDYDIDIPQYGIIKRYYLEKGPNLAFILGIYYIPSPIMYEVIQVIEKEVAKGNCGYRIDGIYYNSPEEDPYFIAKRERDNQSIKSEESLS